MKYSFKWVITFFILLYLIITFLFFNFYKKLAIEDKQREGISILKTIKTLYIKNAQFSLLYNNILNKKTDFKYKITLVNSTNPENMLNTLEKKLLQHFQNNEIKEFVNIREDNGTKYIYIALPIEKQENITKNRDELYAIISTKIPVSNIFSSHIKEFTIGGLAMLFAFLIFIFFTYLLHKQELKLQSKKDKLLENQNKLASMGEMINNIAHQWRQPLAQISSILVNMELRSKKGKLTEEIIEKKIQDANKQITFMSETINDFRNFYLRQKAHKEYHVSEAIRHAKQLLSASVCENKIELLVDIDNDFTLFGCHSDLTQAIINIINNAKDALVENHIQNKKIMIKSYVEEQKKILSIEDNAGGIPDTVFKKIFEPYFTTKHPNIATGIGLYMSKTIIEKKYNGLISAKNTEKGAKFTMTFSYI